jgi:hypothetical protein
VEFSGSALAPHLTSMVSNETTRLEEINYLGSLITWSALASYFPLVWQLALFAAWLRYSLPAFVLLVSVVLSEIYRPLR